MEVLFQELYVRSRLGSQLYERANPSPAQFKRAQHYESRYNVRSSHYSRLKTKSMALDLSNLIT